MRPMRIAWLVLVLAAAASPVIAQEVAQDSATPQSALAVARLRDADIARIRSESAHRDAQAQRTIAALGARLASSSANLQQALAGVSAAQPRERRLDALASAAPELLDRIRSGDARYAADARGLTFRATDRVIVIERGLESLQLKADALHSTAMAFNAGFDMGALASPASFSSFEPSIEKLRNLTAEKQRGAIDLLVGWIKKVPGASVVSSLAGVVVDALSNPSDSKKTDDMKVAGQRLLCIAAVSQTALDQMASVRRASERLEQLADEVRQRAAAGGSAIRAAVQQKPDESFEAFMRRTYGDLATDATRQPLPYDKIEPALLPVAAAARLEYDLSRSSADLSTELTTALQSAPVTSCPDENRELQSRLAALRPAVRNLAESLTSLASADDGIAVFVPPLPGR